jgi:hypothetical protein
MKDRAIRAIAKLIFDTDKQAKVGAEIMCAVVNGQSSRWSDIAREMSGSESAAYKRLQRFMKTVDLREIIGRLHHAEAPFVIGDPTEMERPAAKNTDYVGVLKDGKTRGYWMMMLATPYQGRGLPCGFVTYSSATIGQEVTSRNQYHFEAISQIKDLLGERPLVLDREFSYLGFLETATIMGLNFVVRLKYHGKNRAHFTDELGNPIEFNILPGDTEIYNQVYYKGKVPVNVIGTWGKRFSKPLWVMTSLTASVGLVIYKQRMKIELSFRDMKSLLGLNRLMNRKVRWMEQTVALCLLAFSISLVTGELLRRLFYGGGLPDQPDVCPTRPSAPSRKWLAYSGPFVFIKFKRTLSRAQSSTLLNAACASFSAILFPRVRTLVQT